MAFQFEKLNVWQRSLELTLTINKLTKTFPSEEKFNLSSQIQRASDSITLNIAEGSTGQSRKEFSSFLGIALRSAIEVVACLYIGKKRSLIKHESFEMLYEELTEIIKMIQALRNSLREA